MHQFWPRVTRGWVGGEGQVGVGVGRAGRGGGGEGQVGVGVGREVAKAAR